MSSKRSLVWTIWKITEGFWENYLRGRRRMRWVIGSREERTIFPRQAWHRGRQELSSQMVKWRLLCCYFNNYRLHVKGYLDKWCASISGHAVTKKDPTFTRTSAQVARPSARWDEESSRDCHLNTGPLDLLGSVKTAGLLFVSFELLSASPKTQHKGCIYLWSDGTRLMTQMADFFAFGWKYSNSVRQHEWTPAALKLWLPVIDVFDE